MHDQRADSRPGRAEQEHLQRDPGAVVVGADLGESGLAQRQLERRIGPAFEHPPEPDPRARARGGPNSRATVPVEISEDGLATASTSALCPARAPDHRVRPDPRASRRVGGATNVASPAAATPAEMHPSTSAVLLTPPAPPACVAEHTLFVVRLSRAG